MPGDTDTETNDAEVRIIIQTIRALQTLHKHKQRKIKL